MNMRLNCLCVAVCAFSLAGCFTLPAAEDVSEGHAHIAGDYHIRAASPVDVYLRSVDGRALSFWHNGADVAPGAHRLLVDCRIASPDKVSRYELNITVVAGVRYRLEADATSRDCNGVTLVAVTP